MYTCQVQTCNTPFSMLPSGIFLMTEESYVLQPEASHIVKTVVIPNDTASNFQSVQGKH